MAALAGTISYLTTAYVTAASSGDATTIAGMFNGVKIAGVDITDTATASAVSTLVTITWPAQNVRAGQDAVLTAILGVIAGDSALTSPVTNVYVRTEGKIV